MASKLCAYVHAVSCSEIIEFQTIRELKYAAVDEMLMGFFIQFCFVCYVYCISRAPLLTFRSKRGYRI
jgi:hypothetical protein